MFCFLLRSPPSSEEGEAASAVGSVTGGSWMNFHRLNTLCPTPRVQGGLFCFNIFFFYVLI